MQWSIHKNAAKLFKMGFLAMSKISGPQKHIQKNYSHIDSGLFNIVINKWQKRPNVCLMLNTCMKLTFVSPN